MISPASSSFPSNPLTKLRVAAMQDHLSNPGGSQMRPLGPAEAGLDLMARTTNRVESVSQMLRATPLPAADAPAAVEIPSTATSLMSLRLDAPPAVRAETSFRALLELSEQRTEQLEVSRMQVYNSVGVATLTQSPNTTQYMLWLLSGSD